jgi:hypothetical protein
MEKKLRIFRSHAEAEEADAAYYRSLTGQERLDIMLELVEEANRGVSQRFEKVCRIVKREGG